MGNAIYRIDETSKRIRKLKYKDTELITAKKVEIVSNRQIRLMAEWLFNGNLFDTSGNGYDLTNLGGVFVDGYDGRKAIYFDASSSAERYFTEYDELYTFFTDKKPFTVTFLLKTLGGLGQNFIIKFSSPKPETQTKYYHYSVLEINIGNASSSANYGTGLGHIYDWNTVNLNHQNVSLYEYTSVIVSMDGTNLSIQVNGESASVVTQNTGYYLESIFIPLQYSKNNPFTVQDLRLYSGVSKGGRLNL